jgi:hypothetical protein
MELKMAKTEAQWQAESDADTLINAEKIKKDAKRRKAARAELKKRDAATKAAMQKS